MDETMARRNSRHTARRKNAKPYLLAAGAALLILVIVAVVALSAAQLNLVLTGGNEITVEYGEAYAEPGASASLLFFKAAGEQRQAGQLHHYIFCIHLWQDGNG